VSDIRNDSTPQPSKPTGEAPHRAYPQPQVETPNTDHNIDNGNFEWDNPNLVRLVGGETPVLVIFLSPSCPTCDSMAFLIKELEAEFGKEIQFYHLNSAQPGTERLRKALAFRYPPHYFLIDSEGEVVANWVGLVSRGELSSAFADLISAESVEK
jgi:thiol-disulfide isomerase/thioredoxin